MQGRIEKALSGFYYVKAEDGITYACKPRGIFRKKNTSPLVGDMVEMEVTDDKDLEGTINKIEPRKTCLNRPPVANIDQALIVFAMRDPDIHLGLLDRFIVTIEACGIEPIICISKTDLDDENRIEGLLSLYKGIGYKCIGISSKTGIGIEEIKRLIKGKISTVAGPSGAGKSTLINSLVGEASMEIGEVSKKTGRGKQTTRHSELLPVDSDTYIADTPGFGALLLPEMKPEELEGLFPEFLDYLGKCKFSGCSHIHEPGCSIIENLDKIAKSRYEHYCSMYEEIKERERF